jgi:hypothetical protein
MGISYRCCQFGAALSRFVPNRMRLRILRGPLRGAKWIAGAASGAGKGLSVIAGRSEPVHLRLIRDLIRSDDVCFDIGANVGLYTILFAKHSKHVVAFEPVPRNLKYLYEMVEINHFKNKVTIVPWAVSDRTHLSMFQENEDCARGSLSDK